MVVLVVDLLQVMAVERTKWFVFLCGILVHQIERREVESEIQMNWN
jgi:hypothetical protein